MKIFVEARTNMYENSIKKISETNFKVSVTEPAIKGKANRAIIVLLAEHFGVAKSQVMLVSGFSSKNKVFEVK